MLDSQRRLYDTGVFTQVEMAVQNPEGSAEQKNLMFQLKEAKRYTFTYGFGIEAGTGVNGGQGTSPQGQTGVSPRVSFDVTRINFRGKDQSIIFKSSLGALQQRVLLSFDSPRFFDLPNWKWTVSGFYDNTINVTTFTSQRLEFATQLEQKAGKGNTLLYGFSFRRVKASNFPVNFDPRRSPSTHNRFASECRVLPSFATVETIRLMRQKAITRSRTSELRAAISAPKRTSAASSFRIRPITRSRRGTYWRARHELDSSRHTGPVTPARRDNLRSASSRAICSRVAGTRIVVSRSTRLDRVTSVPVPRSAATPTSLTMLNSGSRRCCCRLYSRT